MKVNSYLFSMLNTAGKKNLLWEWSLLPASSTDVISP